MAAYALFLSICDLTHLFFINSFLFYLISIYRVIYHCSPQSARSSRLRIRAHPRRTGRAMAARIAKDLRVRPEVFFCFRWLSALHLLAEKAGAAVTITIMALAAVHTLGITVQLPVAIILSVMAALGACGASGVAGGSLLLIPMACSLFGISNDVAMQVVGVGFIIGVIQDSLETAINSSSDALFTAVAEFRQWRKNGKEIQF